MRSTASTQTSSPILLLEGEGGAADNIFGGPECSTLSNDAYSFREFGLMLSIPPNGESWASDQVLSDQLLRSN